MLPEIGQGATDLRANMTLDCGVFGALLSVGNQVFDDRNNDGYFDPIGEVGINGVQVNLYPDINGDGNIESVELAAPMLTTTTTTSGTVGGFYLFRGLPCW